MNKIDTLLFLMLFLTMQKRFFLIICILFLLNSAVYGFEVKGLQPVDPYGVFSAFSAESLPKGKAAFSGGVDISVDPNFYRFVFKTAYGLSDTMELSMTMPYIFGNDVDDGFEDTAFGFKHRFFEEGKYGPSLAYILNASLPSGRDGLTTDGRYGIGLIVSKRVGPVNGHLNVLYEKPGDSNFEDEVSFLAGIDFSAAHNFKLLGELYCRKGHDSENVDLIEGRVGYRFKTTDWIYTTFGAGFDFKNRNPESRLMFSVTFLIPHEKKTIKKIFEEE
jgi:hypothetical protein